MNIPGASVPQTVKIAAIASVLLATASLALAQEPAKSAAADKLVENALPYCADRVITRKPMPMKLPAGFKGELVELSVKGHGDDGHGHSHTQCEGQYATIVSPTGSVFVGVPWSLADVEGATIEEKLKNFSWQALQQSATAVVDRSQRTRDGLYRVTLNQLTDRGKVPLEGAVDADGRVFFLGHFVPQGTDPRTARVEQFKSLLANAPARGASKPEVTVIEFSDFQCPSCKHASHYLDPILAKHGARVRYIRMDLPLVSFHPWALSAAVAGRAIYRQKPDAFWTFKDKIYENQDKLNTFTIDDFTRAAAEDLDLDMTKYDADVASAAIRDELLKGVGLAFTNDVRATPTYMVNGAIVDAGDKGEALAKYVESLLTR